jgi:hypothetical protein
MSWYASIHACVPSLLSGGKRKMMSFDQSDHPVTSQSAFI